MTNTNNFSIELKAINNNDLSVLKNLFQLYIHDISHELPWNVNADGLFEAYSLDDWFKDENNFGFIIYVENNIAGFVMIDKEFKVLTNTENSLNLSEIFILNNFKGKGIAKKVALKIFDTYKSNWEIRPVPTSNSAEAFWQKVFSKSFPYPVTKHEWKENRFAYTFSNL